MSHPSACRLYEWQPWIDAGTLAIQSIFYIYLLLVRKHEVVLFLVSLVIYWSTISVLTCTYRLMFCFSWFSWPIGKELYRWIENFHSEALFVHTTRVTDPVHANRRLCATIGRQTTPKREIERQPVRYFRRRWFVPEYSAESTTYVFRSASWELRITLQQVERGKRQKLKS